MSSTTNISLFGDASPNQIAIWVCGVALVLLLGAIIAKTKGSGDLRFLTYCVLAGVFGILGFAHFSPDRPAATSGDAPQIKKTDAPRQPTGHGHDTQAPITDEPRPDGEYQGNSPGNSPQNATPAPLLSPHAGSGVADRTNGS